MDRLLEAGLGTERRDQFDRGAHPIDRWDLEDTRITEVDEAVVLVLLQKGVEHRLGLLAVLAKDVPLPNIVGPLVARQGRPPVGDVADQVERVEVGIDLLGQRVEPQSPPAPTPR
jgi:hypothetical protein